MHAFTIRASFLDVQGLIVYNLCRRGENIRHAKRRFTMARKHPKMSEVTHTMVRLERQLVGVSTQVRIGDTISCRYPASDWSDYTVRSGKIVLIRECLITKKIVITLMDEDMLGPIYRSYNLAKMGNINICALV